MLRPFGRVDAIEVDGAAREIASKRLGQPSWTRRFPRCPACPTGAYDLIAILDVIEHVEEDVAGMRASPPS